MSQNSNLVRDGINQLERLPRSLNKDFIKLDDRSFIDYYSYVYNLSLNFHYIDHNGDAIKTWQNLLPSPDLLEILIKSKGEEGKIEPQIALLITFLRLITYAQNDLNGLISKHVDAYYKRALGFLPKPVSSDQVHVFFELKKNHHPILIEKGAKLEAGADRKGRKIIFETNKDLYINSAKISKLKSLFYDKKETSNIYASFTSNSSDGLGEAFSEDNQFWPMLGPSKYHFSENKLNELRASLGVALSSPMFLLSGGERIITIEFEYNATLNDPIKKILTKQLEVSFSGEKEWLKPSSLHAELTYRQEPIVRVSSITVTYNNIDVADFNVGSVTYYSPFAVNEEGNLYRTRTIVRTDIETNGLRRDAVVLTEVELESLAPIFKIIAILSEAIPAIDFPSFNYYPDGPKSEWPICKISLLPVEENSYYSFLKNIRIKKANIQVQVNGLTNLSLENDQGILNSAKSFQPFGSIPAIGNSIYLGTRELAHKSITSFSIDLLWSKAPVANLSEHYFPYDEDASLAYSRETDLAQKKNKGIEAFNSKFSNDPDVSLNQFFNTNLAIRFNKKWLDLTPTDSNSLFGESALGLDSQGKPNYHTIKVSSEELKFYSHSLDLTAYSSSVNESLLGYIALTLNGPLSTINAFGHQDYNRAAINAFIHNANPANNNNQRPIISAPYTPELKEIKLNYSSTTSLSLDQPLFGEQFFYIEPFGYYPYPKGGTPTLFPAIDHEGNLFIGLTGIQPPQQVSLLFQLLDGSADSAVMLDSTQISWAYLSNNQWINIPREHILQDTTQGFQTSGIVEIVIGKDANNHNSRFLDDLFWLRVSTAENPQGANLALSIHSQATTATRVLPKNSDQNENSNELEFVLPPNQIKNFAKRNAVITQIYQPYASFGGRLLEKDENFLARASERLRHKNRAITYWDFERMVLEAFPFIFKVKCLSNTGRIEDIDPGKVAIIVISNLRRKNAVNPFQPKSSSITLSNVKSYLSKFVSPFVELSVENPIYEPILLDFKVSFKPGFDPGFYSQELNRDIKKHLSPWAFTEGEDIVVGGRISASSILKFIEERNYVDYVTNFELYHLYDGKNPRPGIGEVCIGADFIVRKSTNLGIADIAIDDTFVVGEPEIEAIASTSRSVLVSAYDHRVRVLETGVCKTRISALGIGFMRVGADFIVGSYDYAIGNTEIVTIALGGNPAFHLESTLPEHFRVFAESELPNK